MRGCGYRRTIPTGERRYSPIKAVSEHRRETFVVPGNITTSHIEQLNLTLRMSQCRWTRLINAFSKKLENLKAAGNLFCWHNNFYRMHKSLDAKPAMAALLEYEPVPLESILRD